MKEDDGGFRLPHLPRPLAAILVLELAALACEATPTPTIAQNPALTVTPTWEVVGIPYAHATDQAAIQEQVSVREAQKKLENKLPERFPDGIMQMNFKGNLMSGVGSGVFADLGFVKIVDSDNQIHDYLLGKIVTVAHNAEKTYGGPIDQMSGLSVRSAREANPDELNHDYHDVIPIEWQYIPGTENSLIYLSFAVRLDTVADAGWFPVDAGYFVDGGSWVQDETVDIAGFPAGINGIPYFTEGTVVGYEGDQFVIRAHLINGNSGSPAIRQGKYIFGFVNNNTDAIPGRGVLTLASPDFSTQMRDKNWITGAKSILSARGYSLVQ